MAWKTAGKRQAVRARASPHRNNQPKGEKPVMLIAEAPSVAADRKASMLQSAHLYFSSSSAEVRSASDPASAGIACESPPLADDVPKIGVTPVENAPPQVSKVDRKFLGA